MAPNANLFLRDRLIWLDQMKERIMPVKYPQVAEQAYCASPSECLKPDLLIIGSAIGTMAAKRAIEACCAKGQRPLDIVVLERGPFDLPVHLGDLPGYRRLPFVASPSRLGGKLMVWGVSTPRPRDYLLRTYPYPYDTVLSNFSAVEAELGVPEQIPMSGRLLEHEVISRLQNALPDARVKVAPLAIDKEGRRWHPLKNLPDLVGAGVRFVARFEVSELRFDGDIIETVSGTWLDGQRYTIEPRHVIFVGGLESSLSLLQPIVRNAWPTRISDHFRIDSHGMIAPGSLVAGGLDDLGIAVAIVEDDDECDGARTPFHLEVKVAPCGFWRRGFMQSSDNLVAQHSDDMIYWQIQVVSAMKDPLPIGSNVLHTGQRIPSVMTERDAKLHGRLVSRMSSAAAALEARAPAFAFRELGTNHHLYRGLTVGEAVDQHFRSTQCSNLTVLPPTAFFNHECDANPTLKSIVLTRIAIEELVASSLTFDSEVDVQLA